MGFFRPSADDIDGNWLNEADGTTLYSSLDEASPSDSDFIKSPVDPVAETCRVALEDATGASQPFTVRYRFNNDGTVLRVRLVQGASTEIATWTETAAGWNTVEYELSDPQFALITDASDLFVEFTATDATLTLNLDFTTGTLDSKVVLTRTTTASYVNSSGVITSAAIDAARFDYTPVTLTPRGLLIEEQRTNLCKYSQEFDRIGDWARFQTSGVGINTAAAPDGTTTADTWTENTATNIHQLASSASSAMAVGTGTTYTMSLFAKAGTGRYLTLTSGGYSGAETGFRATFDLQTGAVTQSGANSAGGTLTDAKSEDFGSGWYRLIITGSVPSNGNQLLTISSAGAATFTPDGVGRHSHTGTSKSYHLWGGQTEIGAFATSYIATVAAAVVRAADVATMTGTNFSDWYNASEGTFVAEFDGPASGTRPVVTVDDNTANEVIMLYGSGADPKTIVTDGGATQADIDAGTLTANTSGKLGLSFAAADFAACFNGGTVATDTSGTLPTVTQARLGAGPAGNYLTGHLASLKFYNVAKADAALQALTSS